MVTLWEAVILGLVQGLTEWLPVSSDGHLALVGHAVGEVSLLLGLALHLGTAVALLAYQRTELRRLAGLGPSTVAMVLSQRSTATVRRHPDRLLALWILVSTAATASVGLPLLLLLDGEVLTTLPVIGVCLLLTSLFVALSRRWPEGTRTTADLAVWEVALLGLLQGLAALPGLSRSGTTIGVGMARGLGGAEAGRLSFLLAVPPTVGVSILSSILVLRSGVQLDPWVLLAGMAAAGVVGYGALGAMMRLLRRGSGFHHFAWYTLALGSAVLLWSLVLSG